MFIRVCSTCDKEKTHKNKLSYERAIKNNLSCNSCVKKKQHEEKLKNKIDIVYKRICPVCKKEKTYKDKRGFNHAIKHNVTCSISCGSKKTNSDIEIIKKKKEASSGKNNPMYGRSFYEIWVAKYGKEIADIKLEQFKNKKSIQSSGNRNPMFGKPSPQGSGNGWKGWYKETYFASLRELYYLKYLFDNNIKFENGEQRKYKIEYQFMNKKANYFPDFYLIETQEYIEVKPKKLIDSPKNKAKFEAARNKFGNRFKIVTEDNLEKINLIDMYNMFIKKEIIFMEKYEIKFIDFYNTNKEE